MYLAFCSIVIIFNIRLSSVCLMMINVFDRKLTFSFLNTMVFFAYVLKFILLRFPRSKLNNCILLPLIVFSVTSYHLPIP